VTADARLVNRLYDAYHEYDQKGLFFSWERGPLLLHLRLSTGDRRSKAKSSVQLLSRVELDLAQIDLIGLMVAEMYRRLWWAAR
jgi:hypothetical protein